MAEANYFPFGQFRRSSQETYLINLKSGMGAITTYLNSPSESISEGIAFQDKIIDFGILLQAKSYYLLRLKIKRDITEQVFNIKLQNVSSYDSLNRESQYIGKYTVPITTSKDPSDPNQVQYSTILIVINPNTKYLFMVVLMVRTIKDDYTNYSEEGGIQQIGRKFEVIVDSFYQFENIIKNSITLTKIGIQAAPGMLFCINGEGIRIGPSGIYLINNGYEIDFIGVAIGMIPNNIIKGETPYDYEYFTIDYRYK